MTHSNCSGADSSKDSNLQYEMFPDLNSVLEPVATQRAAMYVSNMDRKTQSAYIYYIV